MTLADLTFRSVLRCIVLILALLTIAAKAQITPSADAYTNTADPTTNYGASVLLNVGGATQTAYIQFNLSSIPSGASVSQATLKLYVDGVAAAGTFNVDYVSGAWMENKITSSLAPALGTMIAVSGPLAKTSTNQYVLIDITPAVVAWLDGTQTNDGIALVANGTFHASFDSKENTTTSHPPELDIVFADGSSGITGITTGTSSGLTGGGTSGTLNLSLLTSCGSGQVLEWNGSAWACTSLSGGGSITGVTAGTDLTGGGTSGNVTLNLDLTKVPQLAAANTFTGNQTVTGNLTATGTLGASVLNATDATLSDVLSITSAALNPIFASTSASTGATAVYGAAASTTTTGTVIGVEGVTAGSSNTSYGAVGYAVATSGNPIGVYGLANSPIGTGVFGQNGTESTTGAGLTAELPLGEGGVWGDAGLSTDNSGVIGTADNAHAGFFVNNSSYANQTMVVQSLNILSIPFVAIGVAGFCDIDQLGDISCTGSKNAIVPIDGGRRTVAMSAIESPQNWFEDAGAAELVNGTAIVTLDPVFIQTVNAEMDYKVFPVPNGDCKGLYVTNKTATSFEVRELGGGTSSLRFDYRIMALRKNYENVRFADHTQEFDRHKRMQERAQAAPETQPQSHTPTKEFSPARPLVRTTALK